MDISHRPTGFTQGNTLAETSLAAETSPQTSLMPEAQAGQTNRLKFSQDDFRVLDSDCNDMVVTCRNRSTIYMI